MIETVVIKGEQCKKHYFNVCPSVGWFFFLVFAFCLQDLFGL